LKKLEEEEYTRTALATLGLTSSASIDSSDPKTKEDFTELSEAIVKKLSNYKNNDEYVPFLDELVRSLLAGLSSTSMRKIKTSVDNLILEKQKLEKGDKPKKKTAAKQTKVKLRLDNEVSS
jgi:translation initiation factor 3 subunit J